MCLGSLRLSAPQSRCHHRTPGVPISLLTGFPAPKCHPPVHSPHSNPGYLLKQVNKTTLPLCLKSPMASHHTQNKIKSVTRSHKARLHLHLFAHNAQVLQTPQFLKPTKHFLPEVSSLALLTSSAPSHDWLPSIPQFQLKMSPPPGILLLPPF